LVKTIAKQDRAGAMLMPAGLLCRMALRRILVSPNGSLKIVFERSPQIAACGLTSDCPWPRTSQTPVGHCRKILIWLIEQNLA